MVLQGSFVTFFMMFHWIWHTFCIVSFMDRQQDGVSCVTEKLRRPRFHESFFTALAMD